MNDQSTAKGTETRERIVETARTLFFDQGYAKTGMAQILKSSGANSGSLYHFFPTKEDLLIAVLQKYEALLEPAVLRPAFDRVSDPLERVFAILDGYRRLLEATDFRLGCPIGNLALEMANDHPQVRLGLCANFDGWQTAVREQFEALAGRLPEGTDANRLATTTLTVMEGAVMLARSYRSFEPFDAAVESLRDYLDLLLSSGSDWNQRK